MILKHRVTKPEAGAGEAHEAEGCDGGTVEWRAGGRQGWGRRVQGAWVRVLPLLMWLSEKRFDENEQNIHPNLRGTSGRVRGGGRAAAAGPGTPAWAPPPPRTRPSP